MEYNKIIIGFVVQSYRDGECVRQEFIASEEVSREDPASGESIEVDVKAERYQPMDLVQPISNKDHPSQGAAHLSFAKQRSMRVGFVA